MQTGPTIRNGLPAGVTLVGAGKMGGALLNGWLAAGLDATSAAVVEACPSPEIVALSERHGLALNPEQIGPCSVLVLAVKPQGLAEAAAALDRFVGPETLLVSILAGKTIADIKTRIAGARAVVRAMPNLPASIGRGTTGAVASAEVTPAQRASADALLACAGLVEWLDDEALIDAVTAVSGSGPAYVALLAETLAEAGVAVGLPAAVAARLARSTIAGTGALLDGDPREARQLRIDVTSPGGTTAAALDVLQRQGGLPDLMREAVAAAKRRAEELSG